MNYKVIGTDSREYGPISAEQVRQWIAERRLNSMSLAQAEGTNEWRPLTGLPDFAPTVASIPASVAAPLPPMSSGSPRTNSMAVLGLVMGILTVTMCSCCHGFPTNLLGIIFSAIALSQISSNPQMERGKGMAIAGLVLCVLGSLMGVLLAVLGLWIAGLPHHAHMFRL